MLETSPKKCRYRQQKECVLKKQSGLRNLAPSSWSDNVSTQCVFVSDDETPKHCPVFTYLDGTMSQTEGGVQAQWEDFNSNIGNQDIHPKGHLSKAIAEFGSKEISFCAMYGPVHYSFCVFCPSYSGRAVIGDSSKRRPGTCTLARRHNGTSLGTVEGNSLRFYNQTIIDVNINGCLFAGWPPTRILFVPMSETDIRSAYNIDIPKWDYLRYSQHYCLRCGPENTGNMQYGCKHCNTADICNKCSVSSKTTIEDNGTRTVNFTCPECKHRNNINLGIDDCYATYFSKSISKKSKNSGLHAFLPFEYGLIKLREDCALKVPYATKPLGDDYLKSIAQKHGLPHPDVRILTIEAGMSKGTYLMHDESERAWLFDPTLDWTAALTTTGPVGLISDTFIYDVIISYKTKYIVEATRVRHYLEKKGLYVFMIESSRNQWDGLWNIRFAQAIYKARYHLFIVSDMLFSSHDACMEIKEFLYTETVRQSMSGDNSQLVFGVGQLTREAKNHLVSRFTKEEQNKLEKCMMDVKELTKVLKSTIDAPQGIFSTKVHYYEKIEQEDESKCVNCKSDVYFEDEKQTKIDDFDPDQWPAFACIRGHRYCMNCDGHAKGGLRGSCPKCHAAGDNVKGQRLNRSVYYGNFSPKRLYGVKYNPNEPTCPNCSRNLDFDAAEALICKGGHRFCQTCSIVVETEYKSACPECHNLTPRKISIGTPFNEDAYYYGATKDIPDQNIFIVNPKGKICWLCFVDIEEPIGVRFRPGTHVCQGCLASLAKRLSTPDSTLQLRWDFLAESYRVGMFGKRTNTPSCSVCSKRASTERPIAFALTKTMGQNFIFSICQTCFKDSTERLTKQKIDL